MIMARLGNAADKEQVALTARRLTDPSLIAIVLLGSLLLLVLALDGGGYGPALRNQIGILAWWLLALGVLAGLLPLRLPGPLGSVDSRGVRSVRHLGRPEPDLDRKQRENSGRPGQAHDAIWGSSPSLFRSALAIR